MMRGAGMMSIVDDLAGEELGDLISCYWGQRVQLLVI